MCKSNPAYLQRTAHSQQKGKKPSCSITQTTVRISTRIPPPASYPSGNDGALCSNTNALYARWS